jgi:hypothetical protein
VHNDGGGEFADYVVIEIDGTAVSVGLRHAKYAGDADQHGRDHGG